MTARSPKPSPEPSPVDGAGRTMLVEDQAIIALDLADTLRGLGLEIGAIARSSSEAIAAFERGFRPELAIVDLRLDDGEDGEHLLPMLTERGCACLVFSGDADGCARVRERYPDVPVLQKPARDWAVRRAVLDLTDRV